MFNSKIIWCFLFFMFLFNASKANSIFKHSNLTVTNEINKQNEGVCVKTSACIIECRDGIIANIWKDFPYNASCDVFKLYIRGYVGKRNEIITKDWFSKLNQSTFIGSLFIENSSFEIIEDDVFNSPHFSKTTILFLNGLKVQHITKDMFNGLSSLMVLNINNITLKIIDENVLYGMRYTLRELAVTRLKEPFSLKNLTETVVLLNLKYLYLYANSFGHLIDEKSFTGVNGISLMHLSNSGIITIHEHTFDNMRSNLNYLYLTDNKLTTLSGRTFLLLLKEGIKIFLEGNPWICDCNLLDLQYLLQTYPKIFYDVPKCASPAEFKDQPIVNSNFCTKKY